MDFTIGTLSKAIGVVGGYVAGKKVTIDWLKNRGRPFLFSTGMPPAAVGAVIEAIKMLMESEEYTDKLWENANFNHDEKTAQEYLDNIFIENQKYSLFVKGTNFQINVWKALLNLPNGLNATYQDIANFIDKPKDAKIVENAIKKENHQHTILVKNLEEKIAFQKKNSKKPEIQNFESIAFKMAVLNQQVALLTEISNQKN